MDIDCSSYNHTVRFEVLFEVLTAVTVKITVFWDVMPYSLISTYLCFGCLFYPDNDAKCRLYAKLNVTKYRKIIHCLIWPWMGLKKIFTINQKFIVCGPVCQVWSSQCVSQYS
jgi:hypothetical protein